MMEMSVSGLDASGTAKGVVSLDDEVFSVKFNEPLVHQVVTAWMSCARSGTKAQKGRSDVRGSGRKPWRQKGTGRARAGTRKSPLWRGGGVIFPARPHNRAQKVNRKMYRGAMRSILSELIRQKRLDCVDSLTLAEPKTKLALDLLGGLGMDARLGRVLAVMGDLDLNFVLGARNLPWVKILEVSELNPRGLIAADRVLFTRDALETLEGYLR